MNRLRSRGATIDHVRQLLPTLRPEDAREVRSSTGRDPAVALCQSIGISAHAGVALDELDRVIFLYGVARVAEGIGAPWMVASTYLPEFGREIARRTWFWVDRFNAAYPLLTNRADLRNSVHLRWLRWAGFQFGQVVPAQDGSPFIEFFRHV